MKTLSRACVWRAHTSIYASNIQDPGSAHQKIIKLIAETALADWSPHIARFAVPPPRFRAHYMGTLGDFSTSRDQ
eukprot:SAG11_NODE_2845_length_2913_cov_2.068230_5_plen_75_part_00